MRVGDHRVMPAPDPVVGVRGHVLDVARARDRRAEMVRARLRLAGAGGGFGGVNVEVAGARVGDVQREGLLEHPVDLLHLGVLDVPVAAPGLEQHERLAEEGADLDVAGMRLPHLLHRRRVGLVQLQALIVALVLGRVADDHRVDEGPLDVGPGLRRQFLRLVDGGVGGGGVLGEHRAVQIAAQRPCLAEVAHGALGIVALRFLEGAVGVRGREGVHELHALREVRLRCFGVGGDGARVGSEGRGDEQDLLAVGGRTRPVLVVLGGKGRRCQAEKDRRSATDAGENEAKVFPGHGAAS